MSFGITKGGYVNAVYLSLFSIAIGMLFNWHLQFDVDALGAALAPYGDIWWKLIAISCVFLAMAFLMLKTGFAFISQAVGAFAFFILLSPALILLSALQGDLNPMALFLLFGLMSLVIALSGLLSVLTLGFLGGKFWISAVTQE